MTIDLEFDKHHLWHPYTSTSKPLKTYPVVSASGVKLTLENGKELIDGVASWWSAIHGYNVPEINKALIDQSQKMAHVMFGGITHHPAVELGKKLVAITPKELQKVFLCDSGSISVEVALKMAIQYWAGNGKPEKSRFVTIKNGYHGDTFGAMSVCDPVNGMHSLFENLLPKSLFLQAIPIGFETPVDDKLLADFEASIAAQQNELAAFIIEPVVQNAGGIRIYNPQWLREIKKLCDKYQLLLIFDEIATGFGRTGKRFALEHAGVVPDILCVGKALSAGYMTLAATITTDEVAEGVSSSAAGVFMHGPTYMGNPLACAVANASLELLETSNWQKNVLRIEKQLTEQLLPLKNIPSVKDVRVLGAIGAMEMHDPVNVEQAQQLFIEDGVWIRPFGKLVYIMPPYIINDTELEKVISTMQRFAEFSSRSEYQ